MMRIEIRSIIELADPPLPGDGKFNRQQFLEREIDQAAQDPVAYQRSHPCCVKISGFVLKGPIASSSVEKTVIEPGEAMEEQPDFPGL